MFVSYGKTGYKLEVKYLLKHFLLTCSLLLKDINFYEFGSKSQKNCTHKIFGYTWFTKLNACKKFTHTIKTNISAW